MLRSEMAKRFIRSKELIPLSKLQAGEYGAGVK